MKEIQIGYSAEAEKLILRSSDGVILSNPVLMITLRRLLAAPDGDSYSLTVTPNNLSEIYRQIKQSAERVGYTLVDDVHVSEEISHIRKKEEDFETFSRTALDVWSGKVLPKELSDFEEVIADRVKRKLTDLQFLSALHLAFSQNACNFSVPGAGKTTIVYSAFAYLNSLPTTHNKHIDRILVIGPLASFYAWRREYQECFGRPPMAFRLFAGMPTRSIEDVLLGISSGYKNVELVHVSYQTACNYEQQIKQFLSNPELQSMLVIDEAHNIKKEDGVWASSCIRLAIYASARVILTGTPAPNGYEDLYNLFKFLYPERNLVGFPRANLVAMSQGSMPSEPMRQRIKPFFTRITKAHLGLPPFEENRIIVQMSPEETMVYTSLEDLLMPGLSSRGGSGVRPIQRAALIRLRQAASNPLMLLKPLERDYFDDEVPADVNITDNLLLALRNHDAIKNNNKLKMLIKICAEKVSVGEKVLIWSYFISTIDLIESSLIQALGCKVARITGSTPSEGSVDGGDENMITREKIITNFIDDSNLMILVANPQALGESVSLHYNCHTAVYFDRDFNCGRFVQSKDRIHRYGLPKDVNTEYLYLTYADTVDVDINERLIVKETRMNSLVERDEIPLFKGIDDETAEGDDIRIILKSYASRKIL